jgi:hypothetical protein
MFVRSKLSLRTRIKAAHFKRGFSYRCSPLDELAGCRLQLNQDCPDEATEFSGDSGDSDVAMFALIEVPELFVESVLSFECNGNDVGGLPLATAVEDEVSRSLMSIVPGSLNQETPDVAVTRFGDRSPMFFVARRVL